MSQNNKNEQPCMSVRCCCKLIAKCEEKPAVAKMTTKPRNNDLDKRNQISLCDFLKSQPIPDWIKVNDTRPQQLHPQDEQCSTKPTSDERQENSVSENMQSSQIIINFGTVVTNGACKRDSYQQTDPEVKDVTVPAEKKRVCQTTTSPPVNRPSSTCPSANRSTSVCPTPDQSTSTYPHTNRLTSNCPLTNRQTITDPPTNRPTSICPPKNHSKSTGPPTNQSTSTCAQSNRPTSNCPPSNQSTSNSPPTNRPTSTCQPANRSTSTCPAARPESVVNKSTCGCNCHSKL